MAAISRLNTLSRRWLDRSCRAAGLLLALGPIAGPAGAVPGEPVIPSERCRGMWIVPVAFGPRAERLDLAFDTGAASTVIDPEALQRITGRRLAPGRSVRLRDGVAGPLRLPSIAATSQEMDALSQALGRRIDGILGVDAWDHLLLTLDYPAGEIRIAQGPLPAVDGRTVLRDEGRQRPEIRLAAGGPPLSFLVDSGSLRGLTVLSSDVLDWAAAPRPVAGSVRLVGIRLLDAGRLAGSLRLGPLVIDRPVVHVVEPGAARLLGEDVMRRFAWTFDRRSRKIRLVPASSEPITSPPLRGSGIAFRPIASGLEIAHLFPGLPAERAGLRVGDVVVAIDGRRVVARGCEELPDTRSPGASLSLLRAGEPIEVRVAFEDLVP